MSTKVFDLQTRQAQAAGEGAGGAESAEAVKAHQRTPWNGTLADSELDMPGGLLLAALTSCANTRGHHFTQMASELGVTYGYIAQLRNGNRSVSQISDDFALACARYLVVPRMTVLMLAGRITPEDMFESNEMMASEVLRAFEFVCTDPEWGPLVTPEVRKGSIETQYGFVRLYEKATDKKLMTQACDLRTLASDVVRLAEIQAARKDTVAVASTGRKRGPRAKAA